MHDVMMKKIQEIEDDKNLEIERKEVLNLLLK